jgi:hypothetical protein
VHMGPVVILCVHPGWCVCGQLHQHHRRWLRELAASSCDVFISHPAFCLVFDPSLTWYLYFLVHFYAENPHIRDGREDHKIADCEWFIGLLLHMKFLLHKHTYKV